MTANATSFRPGFDPRRNMKGGRGGPKRYTIEQRRESDEIERARESAVNADRTMPLEFLLRTMRNPDLDRHERFAAAKAAAPYCHPVLQAVAHRYLGADGAPLAPMVTVNVLTAPPATIEQP